MKITPQPGTLLRILKLNQKEVKSKSCIKCIFFPQDETYFLSLLRRIIVLSLTIRIDHRRTYTN